MAIPIKTHMTEVDNLPGEETEFTISDARWVMRSLADLYSNRELAVIREYSTNARDAMVEAGKGNRPIEVTLPNAMNPYFKVQDFGVGMSTEELRTTFTQFGNSTKRDSNDFNGMLGFGSKSAVAYTNTFTVTAIKNGVKTVAVVSRKEDYSIVLKILVVVETAEENGVTIEVPVHNWQEFQTKARDFYRFWKPGQVLVNQKEPEWAVGDKIADNLYYYPNHGQSFVVMGNVAYVIANPDALFPRGMNRISFVAYVENGAVEFTPNREALKYSDHTKQNLHKIIDDFVSKAVDTAKQEIAAAQTHAEAFITWTKWRNVIGATNVAGLVFKGDPLVDTFSINGWRYDKNQDRYNTYTIREWSVAATPNTIFITGFVANLSSHHKKTVKDWLNLKGLKTNYIIFTQDDKINSPWIDQNRVFTWELVKTEAPKKPKAPRQSVSWGRKAGTFDLVSSTGKEQEQDVPNIKNLYYILVQEYNRDRHNVIAILREFGINEKVVIVPANRLDKFRRNYPNAKPLLSHLETKVRLDGTNLISKDGQEFLQTEAYDQRDLSVLDGRLVDDPELKRLCALHKVTKAEYLTEYSRQWRLAQLLGIGHKFKRHNFDDYGVKKLKPLKNNYPLAHNLYQYRNNIIEMNHVILYLNAVYAARKEGKNV